MDKKKVFRLDKRALPTILILIIILCSSFKTDKQDFTTNKNLDIFNSLFKELNLFYVDSINAEKTITTGINSMLNSLDPYTDYIPESQKEDFQIRTTGEYGGIGSGIISRPDSSTYIQRPYEGMPAQIAGLKAGDKLVEIDGISLKGLSSSQVSEKLKGQANTIVNVTVERPGEKNLITKSITRKKIVIPAVPYYGVVGDSIGYIYLTSFTDKAAEETKEALLDLKKNYAVKSIILDLRDNGGGVLDDAIQIVNYFVPKGKEVLSTRGKVKQWDRTYKTTQEPIDTEIPLIVMVNNMSASASEIVSGALQDLDRAVILGTRTFGKGLVQSTRELPYNGMLKVTTAKYYIPSGRLIQAIDYSHRNPDGSVGRIPDSLTTVFHTANGREVRDGGGIKPDIEVVNNPKGNISFYLLNDLIFFDFATQYVTKHPSIGPIDSFKLTDEDYNEFKEFVKSKNFKYDKQTSRALNELREIAKFEGYLEEATPEFDALENKLNHNLDQDLDTFKEDIEKILSTEIVGRYYYQKGEILETLKDDKELNKSIEILNNKELYKKLLNLGSTKK